MTTFGQNLKTVGVAFAVEKLSKFRSDMASASKSMTAVKKAGSLLGSVFSGAGKILGGFLSSLRRIGEFVIAGILLRGLEAIAGAVKRMIGTVVEAGLQFQEFTLRIQQFAATELFKEQGGAITFEEALERTKQTATDLLDELALFAIRSPFETIDVVKIFSLSKAFGFAGENAKEMTKQSLNMAAGLGIGAQGAERIVRNLGQMNRLGRVMQRDLNDLANAGVNVAGIMDRVASNMGVTTETLKELQRDGLVPASEFMKAFSQIADEEFSGASERMNKTLKAALSNVKDLVGSFIGLKVVKPILDVLGDKLSSFLDIITGGARGEQLISVLDRIGTTLAGIVNMFFAGAPPGESIADFVIKQLDTLAERLANVKFFLGDETFQNFSTKDKIQTILDLLGLDFLIGPLDFISNVRENIITAVDTIKGIIDEAVSGFEEGGLKGLLFKIVPEGAGRTVLDTIFETLDKIGKFWADNKDDIMKIWTELIQPLTSFVLDLALSGLGVLIEFLGDVADWARKNPDISTPILGLAAAIAILAIAAKTPIVLKFAILIGAGKLLLDILTGDNKAIEKFIKNAQEVGTEWGMKLVDAIFLEITNVQKFAEKVKIIGQLFAMNLVLGMVESDAFKAFFDDFVRPLFDLLGKSLPSADEMADQMRVGIEELTKVGLDMGEATSAGFRDGIGGINASSIKDRVIGVFRDLGYISGQNIGLGIKEGLISTHPELVALSTAVGSDITKAFKNIFAIHSPSKVMEDIGKNINLGLAEGIMKFAGAPIKAMNLVGANVNMAAQSPSVINNNTQNFSMNINTTAKAEPIIGNFRTLQALAGGGI